MVLTTLFFMSIILVCVVFHEYAHGWVANRLGDPTAKYMGRLTLNPLRHIDPIGTIVVPLVLRLLGFMPLGWAKPVPVNFQNLRHPKRDMIWVAIAGPLTNIVLAVVTSQVILRLPFINGVTGDVFRIFVVVNLVLAVFNMIPIPPLDGSRVVMGILPDAWLREYSRLERWGLFIIILMLNFGLLNFIWNIVEVLTNILGVGVPRI